MSNPRRLEAGYLLPLRWTDDADLAELTEYLRRLRRWIDVTVIDGSPAHLFASHAAAWSGLVSHLRPTGMPGRDSGNGKVAGVLTGIRLAGPERVVIADDDVRYDYPALRAVVEALDRYDIVRPQNYFTELPWHARWDSARSLINRAFGSDYPGTLGVRRSALLATGGYRHDVLFENLELIRTVHAGGGSELRADAVFVGRRAPSAGHFWSQRIRQAYDGFAQPARLGIELCLLPLAIWAARRPGRAAGGVALVCGVAELGRRRAGGRAVFPATGALWAPLWVVERGVCAWLAVGARLRGGVRYGEGRLLRAATPQWELNALHRRARRAPTGRTEEAA